MGPRLILLHCWHNKRLTSVRLYGQVISRYPTYTTTGSCCAPWHWAAFAAQNHWGCGHVTAKRPKGFCQNAAANRTGVRALLDHAAGEATTKDALRVYCVLDVVKLHRALYAFTVYVRMGQRRCFVRKPWPVLAPHEYFAAMCKLGKEALLTGPEGLLQSWWLSVAHEGWAPANPAFMQQEQFPLSKTVPVRLHGDEGSSHGKRSCAVLTWMTLAHSHVPDSKHLITLFPSHKAVRAGKRNLTMDAIIEFLVWSFQQLSAGQWPSSGYGGEPLKGKHRCHRAGQPLSPTGLRGVFAGLKGDAKWLAELVHPKRKYSRRAGGICWHCFAVSVPDASHPLLYTQLHPGALWKRTRERHQDWFRNVKPEDRPAVSKVDGWSIELVHADLLHCLWLGAAQDFLGSALYILAQKGVFAAGEDVDSNLECALGSLKLWSLHERQSPCSLQCLSAKSMKAANNSFPELPGKAGDARLFALWLPVVVTCAAMGDPGLQLVAFTACSLARFAILLETAGVIMSWRERDAARAAGQAVSLSNRESAWFLALRFVVVRCLACHQSRTF